MTRFTSLLSPLATAAPSAPTAALVAALITALSAGCASGPSASPAQTTAATLTCGQLGAEIARIEQARHAAVQQQQDAWKVVIPFAVAGRYASARSALAEADQRLGELRAQASRQGCAQLVPHRA